jgi:hypothetical protein
MENPQLMYNESDIVTKVITLSFGMLRHEVWLKCVKVSEKYIVFIFSVGTAKKKKATINVRKLIVCLALSSVLEDGCRRLLRNVGKLLPS